KTASARNSPDGAEWIGIFPIGTAAAARQKNQTLAEDLRPTLLIGRCRRTASRESTMIQKSRFTPRQRQAIIELGQRKSGGGFNQLALSELFAAGMVDVHPADHRIVLTNRGVRAYSE